jgi:Ricin-type beta-trefoil lectin domain
MPNNSTSKFLVLKNLITNNFNKTAKKAQALAINSLKDYSNSLYNITRVKPSQVLTGFMVSIMLISSTLMLIGPSTVQKASMQKLLNQSGLGSILGGALGGGVKTDAQVVSSSSVGAAFGAPMSIVPDTSTYISGGGDGFFLDTTGVEGSSLTFTNIGLKMDGSNNLQKWYFEPSTKLIKNVGSSKCMATNNNAPAYSLLLKTCNVADNTQLWDTAGGSLKNIATAKCAIAEWTFTGNAWTDNPFIGRRMILDGVCSGATSQKFNFVSFNPVASSSLVVV